MSEKNKNFSKISKLFFVCAGLLLPIKYLLARDYGLGAAGQRAQLPFTNLPGGAGIAQVLGSFAGAALALSGSLFLFLIVYGGIIIMTAAGNDTKVKKGKDIIIWAIIGALILGGAYAITSLIFGVFGQG